MHAHVYVRHYQRKFENICTQGLCFSVKKYHKAAYMIVHKLCGKYGVKDRKEKFGIKPIPLAQQTVVEICVGLWSKIQIDVKQLH